MAIVIFGADPTTWLVANSHEMYQNNLSEVHKFICDSGYRSGGLQRLVYCPATKRIFCRSPYRTSWNVPPHISAEIPPGDSPHEISFSATGGFFTRAVSGRIAWDSKNVPASFSSLISQLQATRKLGELAYVWFGHGELCLARFMGGGCVALGDEEGVLSEMLRAGMAMGYTLGGNTSLCQYDKRYYYVEWEHEGRVVDAKWKLPDQSVQRLVGEVWGRAVQRAVAEARQREMVAMALAGSSLGGGLFGGSSSEVVLSVTAPGAEAVLWWR